jgi:hypothetical protein
MSVRGKSCPYARHGGIWGSGDINRLILNLGTRYEWSASCPIRFTPETHSIGGRMGPRADLDIRRRKNFQPLTGIESVPRPSSPSSHNTDYDIPVHVCTYPLPSKFLPIHHS